MECNIKIVKLKQVLPFGTFPKREHNVRFFYHRTDGCYYMYDEKGCEINLTTDGNIIAIDRELIVGSESLSDDSLVCIGLKANYVHPSCGIKDMQCHCQDTYIRAWTYIKDLQDFLQSGKIERNYYRVSLIASPDEGGIVGCSGSAILPDENSDGFRFQFEAGSQVKLYAKPVQGYNFKGWKEYHTNEIMSISPNWSFTIKKDMDLIGVFEKEESPVETYYINVNANPADKGYVVGAGVFTKGARHSITAAPIKGYHFVYWKDSSNRIVSTNLQYDIIVNKDETYTAYFEVDSSDPIVPPTPDTYTVNIVKTPSDKGTVTGDGAYQSGQVATITPIPIEGWNVNSVTASSGNLTNNNDGTYSIVVTQDITIYVTFSQEIDPVPPTPDTYTVTVRSDGNGIIRYRYKDSEDNWTDLGMNNTIQVTSNSVIEIEGIPNENYEFDHWNYTYTASTPNISENINLNPFNKEIDGVLTFEVYFQKKTPDVTDKVFITLIGDGINDTRYIKSDTNTTSDWSKSNHMFTIAAGSSYTFEARPSDDYIFSAWVTDSERLTGSPIIIQAVSGENKTYTAEFIKNKFLVSATINPTTGASIEGLGKYTKGQICTITVTVNSGYTLREVIIDGTKVTLNSNNQYEFMVEKDTDIIINCDEISEPDSYLNLDKTSVTFDAEGGSEFVNITSNVDWTIS